jgi:hypothetical protein
MTDTTHIEILLGQLVEHAHRLATAAERSATAAERIADALEAKGSNSAPNTNKTPTPGAPTPPYGSDTW